MVFGKMIFSHYDILVTRHDSVLRVPSIYGRYKDVRTF